MRPPEGLTAVILERGEHRAVAHTMAVKNGVEAAKVGRTTRVKKNRADRAAHAVPCVGEVIVVVRTLHERVGNRGIRNGNPADYVRVDRLQGRQVDGSRGAFHRGLRRGGRFHGGGFGSRFGCRFRFGFGERRNLRRFGIGGVARAVVEKSAHEHRAAAEAGHCQDERYDAAKARGFHTRHLISASGAHCPSAAQAQAHCGSAPPDRHRATGPSLASWRSGGTECAR